MLDFLHDKTIRFNGTILGFEELDEFSITVLEENNQYAYLQSLQDETIGFLVISPFNLYPQYTFEIEDKDKHSLVLQSHEEAAVLSIVTLKEPFETSSVNLLAPLLINVTNGRGKQIVLPPKFNYGTREPFIREAQVESGE